jgi:hypothetical protein
VRFEIQQNREAKIQFVDQQQLLQNFEEGAMAKCECHIVDKLNQLVTIPHYMHKMEHIMSICI